MWRKYSIRALLIIIYCWNLSKADDNFYAINNMRILHTVSDKFISISIDPAVLLAGVNLSDISLNLAKKISPAYIRLAGPSTPFVRFIDNEDDAIAYRDKTDNVYVTPSMWFGINEWFNLANLTPVFALNDQNKEKGVWNPKSVMPLLEMSHEIGVKCYWQLGQGCLNKTIIEYVEDLNILRQTINSFPEHNETWKIIGSDFSSCNSDDIADKNLENYIRDLDENVDAVMWQSSIISKTILGLTKADLWTSVSKDTQPVTFSSAVAWAVKVGEAAIMENDVIFRELRLFELTYDTPVYWFSLLHKELMGLNVLELKSSNKNPNLNSFAHCTRRQNNFVRSGAITLMIINSGLEVETIKARLGGILLEKSMDVHSYILTQSNESASQILLNGQKLSMDKLSKPEFFEPKLRRAHIRGHISLDVPGQTIAFFVLNGAKNALCSSIEEDLNSILEEINEDQNVSLTDAEIPLNMEGRMQRVGDKIENIATEQTVTLKEIKKKLLNEIEEDKLYNKLLNTRPTKSNFMNKYSKVSDDNREMLHKQLRAFIDKSKNNELYSDNKKKKSLPQSLHLSIQEIEDILKQRAKAKAAARRIKLTSAELDMLMDKATLKIPKHFISKRDINRALLEEKANFYKNNLFDQDLFEQSIKGKQFSKFNVRRSHAQGNRFRRSINRKLLDLKAKMEENRSYLMKRKEHLKKSPPNGLRRRARDINLDLLKKKSESDYGKKKIMVQPSFTRSKSSYSSKNDGKYAHLNLDDEDSREIFFDELMHFEGAVFGDFSNDWNDRDLEKYEKHFFGTGSKHLFPQYPKTRSSKVKSDKYLQFLKPSFGEDSRGFGSTEEQMCDDDFMIRSRKGQELGIKLGKNGKTDDELCSGMDFSDDGFFRKKREIDSNIKAKFLSTRKNIKTEIKKLRQKLKEDEKEYIKEKAKNRRQLKKRTHFDKQSKINQTAANRNETDKRLQNANSKENYIIPQLEHTIQKRSILNNELNHIVVPLKSSLTRGLNSSNSSSISQRNKNYILALPTHNIIRDKDSMNTIGKRKYRNKMDYFRKKRTIADNLVSLEENDIADIGYHPKIGDESIKSEWMHRKNNQLLYKVETTTSVQKNHEFSRGAQENKANPMEKLVAKKTFSDLENTLGKKMKPIKDFFHDVKDTVVDMNESVKDFFKKLF